MKKLLLSILIALFVVQGYAQQRVSEIGVFLGCSYYIGDLNPKGHFNSFTKPAAGVVYRYNLNPRFAFRGNLLYGSIAADDSQSKSADQQTRNLSFKSNIYELSAQAEFNFLDYQIGDMKHPFSPYIFAGLGVFHFNPKADLNGAWYNLQPLATEGEGTKADPGSKRYKLTQASIPFGIGVKTNPSRVIGLAIEWGMRKTFTDYLDDVSKTYVDPAILGAAHGPVSVILADRSINKDPSVSNVGSQRGNPSTKDWYSFAGIVLTIKLKAKEHQCPSYF